MVSTAEAILSIILYLVCYFGMSYIIMKDMSAVIDWEEHKKITALIFFIMPVLIIIAMVVFFFNGCYYWIKTKLKRV